MRNLTGGSDNTPPEKPQIPTHDGQIIFTVLCGNDEFSAWFYQDIMANRGRGIFL